MGQKTFNSREQMLEFRLMLERYKMFVGMAMMFKVEADKIQSMLQTFSNILEVPIDKELKFDFDNLTVSWD